MYFQVFAPNEAAFSGFDIDALCSTPEALREILLYHVVQEVLPSIQIPEGSSKVKSLQGSYIYMIYESLDLAEDILFVNSAIVTNIDVGSNNGLIHVIDSVLEIPAETTSGGSKFIAGVHNVAA